MSFSINGKEVKRGNSKKGTFRVANLKAGKYLVRAAKEGYDADFAEQPAEVQKGEDKTVSFQFRRTPQTASVRVRLTPGSELFVDGSSLGTTQEDTRIVRELKAGAHTFRAQKGKQFQPSQKTLELAAGQTSELDLRLTDLAGAGRDQERPPDSTVTYMRVGRSGSSHLYRNAPGSARRRLHVHGRRKWLSAASRERAYLLGFRSPDRSHAEPRPASLDDRGLGQGHLDRKERLLGKNAAGFILFPKPLSYVQFTIHSQGGKNHAQWLLHYVNEKNHVRCEIDDDGFQAVRVSERKGPEVLARKKGVPASQWYTIRILARSEGATVSLLKGADWETLGDITATGLAATKFGFFVPEGQQLLMANFSGQIFLSDCRMGKRSGRGGRIRTFDLLVPNQALYQAEPRPELSSLVCCTPHTQALPSNS